jgi:hypothetical protein
MTDVKITVLIADASDLQGEDGLLDKMADLVAEAGYGNSEDFRSVIYLTEQEWPESPEEMLAKVTAQGSDVFILPEAGE